MNIKSQIQSNASAADVISVRDIMDRIEALEIECDGIGEDECAELVALRALLASLKSLGLSKVAA